MRIDRVKLVTEMAKRDMTQACLADLAGTSRATISYIREGKSCTDEVGQKIAKALGVDINALTAETKYTLDEILNAITQADEEIIVAIQHKDRDCLLYTSPSPRD